jgi:hypothetical protein
MQTKLHRSCLAASGRPIARVLPGLRVPLRGLTKVNVAAVEPTQPLVDERGFRLKEVRAPKSRLPSRPLWHLFLHACRDGFYLIDDPFAATERMCALPMLRRMAAMTCLLPLRSPCKTCATQFPSTAGKRTAGGQWDPWH